MEDDVYEEVQVQDPYTELMMRLGGNRTSPSWQHNIWLRRWMKKVCECTASVVLILHIINIPILHIYICLNIYIYTYTPRKIIWTNCISDKQSFRFQGSEPCSLHPHQWATLAPPEVEQPGSSLLAVIPYVQHIIAAMGDGPGRARFRRLCFDLI